MPEAAIMKAVLTLAISFIAILGLYFLIRKYASKVGNIKSDTNIDIISKISLPPKNFLYVVNIGNKKLLLGVNDKSVTTLADLSDVVAKNDTTDETVTESGNITTDDFTMPTRNNYQQKELGFSSFIKSIFHKN